MWESYPANLYLYILRKLFYKPTDFLCTDVIYFFFVRNLSQHTHNYSNVLNNFSTGYNIDLN